MKIPRPLLILLTLAALVACLWTIQSQWRVLRQYREQKLVNEIAGREMRELDARRVHERWTVDKKNGRLEISQVGFGERQPASPLRVSGSTETIRVTRITLGPNPGHVWSYTMDGSNRIDAYDCRPMPCRDRDGAGPCFFCGPEGQTWRLVLHK